MDEGLIYAVVLILLVQIGVGIYMYLRNVRYLQAWAGAQRRAEQAQHEWPAPEIHLSTAAVPGEKQEESARPCRSRPVVVVMPDDDVCFGTALAEVGGSGFTRAQSAAPVQGPMLHGNGAGPGEAGVQWNRPWAVPVPGL